MGDVAANEGHQSKGEPTTPGSRSADEADPAVVGLDPQRRYGFLDQASQVLILAMVVGAPWAFGATQGWSIWTLNVLGCGLGLLLLAKRVIRVTTGYRPPRWGEAIPLRGVSAQFRPPTRAARWLTRSLAVLTLLMLVFTAVSAVNWRSRFAGGEQVFNDRTLSWLPFSYDAPATWNRFWICLGLAGFFWSLRDWLLGKTTRETYEESDVADDLPLRFRSGLPDRLALLLWTLCVNGTALGAVSILQRLDGTDKLLWLIRPRFGEGEFHFGPFPYRGNGAQYFNLLWPVAMAFWWMLFRHNQARAGVPVRVGDNPHWVLMPCVLLLIACPLISSSRGGGVVTLCLAVGALGVLVVVNWGVSFRVRLGMLAPFLAAIAMVGYLGWNQYRAGLTQAFADDLGDRIQIAQNARGMALESPLFGTGPGTFGSVYKLYRVSVDHAEAAYAHNDWLETRITYGWFGHTLVLLMLLPPFLRWWIRDGIAGPWDMVAMIWLAMGGCLFHARFDFPFQVYSVALMFLTLAGVCVCLARRS